MVQLVDEVMVSVTAQYTVERLDGETRARILARYHGLPDAVAQAIAALEDETTRHTPTHGGLLARPLNLRVAISWGPEARAEVEDGARWAEALRTAAESTVIPYCCGRDSQGRSRRQRSTRCGSCCSSTPTDYRASGRHPLAWASR
jgi:hypothetical protein